MLWEGHSEETVMLTNRSQLTLLSPRGDEVQTSELGFAPGPADWRGDQSLDFGTIHEMGVKVLRFYRHALYEPSWVADDNGVGEPGLQLAVSGPHGRPEEKRWYVPNLFSGPAPPGEVNISLKLAPAQSMSDDFLQPPRIEPGTRGIVSAHYKGKTYAIPVDDNMGKNIPLGDSGMAVEIVDYYANAKSEKDQFTSDGDEPKNPMLKLRVHAPDQGEPITEIAYANLPFVNYESIKKQPCPVKFWYHHPATRAVPGVEFLQTPDATLYCRVGAGGTYEARGQVKPGDSIAGVDDCQVKVLRHIPHARQAGTFVQTSPPRDEATTPSEAAALVELTTAGRIQQLWLRRNDAQLGVREVPGPSGPLVVMFGYERRPLGFSVKLISVQQDTNSGPSGTPSVLSRVELSAATKNPGTQAANTSIREISASRPLHYGGFTFQQLGLQQLPNGVDLSVLRVTSDPGLLLKYAGGALICAGVLLMLVMRATGRKSPHPSAA
jgi:hypothetical protein